MAPFNSHSQSVLPNPRLLVLESIEQSEDRFLLSVRVEQVPSCPECGQVSKSRHSSHVRRLRDLPWQGLSVQIHLRVQRFRCRNCNCPRKVLTECVEGIPSYLRHTSRLAEVVRVVASVAGGLPGSQLLARLATLTSEDTGLRRVKPPSSTIGSDSGNSIEVLGVDDGAWPKGHSDGTILVDLEQHRVSDRLPDRSAESFEAWLQLPPRIRVISRDRGGLYAIGARLVSPAARQVADRFHLFWNLSGPSSVPWKNAATRCNSQFLRHHRPKPLDRWKFTRPANRLDNQSAASAAWSATKKWSSCVVRAAR